MKRIPEHELPASVQGTLQRSRKLRRDWNRAKKSHRDLSIFVGMIVGSCCLFLIINGIWLGYIGLSLLVLDVVRPIKPKQYPRSWHGEG